MTEAFERLAEARDESPLLHIEQREIRARRRAGGVVWFDFKTLCGGPRSQNDYLELATQFHTVLLSDVPQMSPRLASEARRFTWLVDVLYDRRVKLIISAAVAPEELYTEGPLAHEFPRTVSRLREMQSVEYLALAKRDRRHVADLMLEMAARPRLAAPRPCAWRWRCSPAWSQRPPWRPLRPRPRRHRLPWRLPRRRRSRPRPAPLIPTPASRPSAPPSTPAMPSRSANAGRASSSPPASTTPSASAARTWTCLRARQIVVDETRRRERGGRRVAPSSPTRRPRMPSATPNERRAPRPRRPRAPRKPRAAGWCPSAGPARRRRRRRRRQRRRPRASAPARMRRGRTSASATMRRSRRANGRATKNAAGQPSRRSSVSAAEHRDEAATQSLRRMSTKNPAAAAAGAERRFGGEP